MTADKARQNVLTDAIHRMNARRVVIDSLSGFELALAPTFREDFRESLYRLVAALTGQGLTVMMTAELEDSYTDLMRQVRDAHERLAAAVAHAHTMAEHAARRQEEYQQLSGRLLTLQDEERRRVAIDLHESTGQRLAALTMNLDLVERAGKALDARSRRVLAESRSLAAQCAQEVRTFAYLLHPPLLDEVGLVSAMRWYAEGFTTRSGVQVVMNVGDVGRLPRPIETALFRIVQESLTNVHRHASTSMASIRLMSTADTVVLEIQDQGRGLRDDLRSEHGALLPATLGVGIQGMRERIRQLGGLFDVEFTDQGTTVRVSVPWSGHTHEDDPHPHR
jgi:signal transduction histidine kinase